MLAPGGEEQVGKAQPDQGQQGDDRQLEAPVAALLQAQDEEGDHRSDRPAGSSGTPNSRLMPTAAPTNSARSVAIATTSACSHSSAGRLRDMRDAHRGRDPAALHQLEIEDPIRPRRRHEPPRIGEVEHALVGGEPDPVGLREAGERRLRTARHRLLAELELEIARLREVAAQGAAVVAGVRVGAQGDARPDGLADPAQPLGVVADVFPQLHLEGAKALGNVTARRFDRLGGRLDADRDRGRQALVRAAEKIDHGDSKLLAEQIPERHVARRSRRGREGKLPLEEPREPSQSMAVLSDEEMRRAIERRTASLRRLTRHLDCRRRAARAGELSGVNPHEEELDLREGLARDRVGLRERQMLPPDLDGFDSHDLYHGLQCAHAMSVSIKCSQRSASGSETGSPRLAPSRSAWARRAPPSRSSSPSPLNVMPSTRAP